MAEMCFSITNKDGNFMGLYQKISAMILVSACFLLFGCGARTRPLTSSTSNAGTTDEIGYKIWQLCHGDFGPDLQHATAALCTQQIEKNKWGQEGEWTVAIWLDITNGKDHLTYPLGEAFPLVLTNDAIFAQDVNRDGYDELILSTEVSGNGGTLAAIFHIRNGHIALLADLNAVAAKWMLEGKVDRDGDLYITDPSLSETILIRGYTRSGSELCGTELSLIGRADAKVVTNCSVETNNKKLEIAVSFWPQLAGQIHAKLAFDPKTDELSLSDIHYRP